MVVKTSIANYCGVYFITFTCVKWIKLFEIAQGYNLVYKWFKYLINEGHYIVGYVIMPNHVHVIIAFKNTGKNINTIVGNGKRFLAYELVKQLKNNGNIILLEKMQSWVDAAQKKINKLHQVFEPSFDWKECYNERFISQKLDYIHANPCVGENALVANPQDYEYSSAKYYLDGIEGNIKITTSLELEDINL